jgi:hypothetical protein
MSVLPRIVQFALQLAGAWYWAPGLKRWLPTAIAPPPPYDVLLDAFFMAAIVMIIGHACALVMKDIRRPSGGTLVVTFVLAFVMAGLTLIPQFNTAIEQVIPGLRANRFVYPMVGALLGYWIKR